jgi:lysophospholipase L1-like esterase
MAMPKGVVVMLVGTNDMINSKKLLTVKTYQENYLQLVKTIKKKHELILLTLPPFYEPYLLTRHPREAYGAEGPQARLKAANEEIKIIARKYHCPLIDVNKIFNELGGASADTACLLSNEANSKTRDGVHPTKAGYSVIATAVYQCLKRKGYKAGSIICFGDSITYGLGVEGRGTASGFTYPAILKKLFN